MSECKEITTFNTISKEIITNGIYSFSYITTKGIISVWYIPNVFLPSNPQYNKHYLYTYNMTS